MGLTDADGLHLHPGADKFLELQHISSSFQFQALFALLDKHPLRLEDGLDIFFSLDEERAFQVSSLELLEECTNARSQTCQELHRQAADTPSLSLELLMDRARVQRALRRLNRRRDGLITLDEWKEFLAELLQKDLDFAIEKGARQMLKTRLIQQLVSPLPHYCYMNDIVLCSLPFHTTTITIYLSFPRI